MAAMLIWGCENGKKEKETPKESLSTGTIRISADEAFKPVIEAQIKVFESEYPRAKVIADYKNEAACFNDLNNDSIRMVIVTRGLNREQEENYKQNLGYYLNWGRVAWDAVTVIVHPNAPRNQFTVEELREILAGTSKLPFRPVFDGVRSTSSVRFAMDSILKGAPLGKNVTGVNGSEEVIGFVEKNPTAIGFIGLSWIGNPQDPLHKTFLKKVKVAAIKCINCPTSAYEMPFAANIVRGGYPLVRGLYFILRERTPGVGGNFAEWMKQQQGQLIFKRAYLVPAQMNVYTEDVEIN
ncbi:MAG: substrate-binding domain-containing protein [Dinghuibacter sp.]|nr:substrate-binding domain-containing protein [Dinghuibacter sp.]